MSERSSLILYKYNSQGEHQWTVPTQLDLPSRQSGYGVNHQLIVVNRAGDLHMLGILGGSEYSLAKYTTNGERSWAQHLASLSDRYAEPRLAVDAEDRFVVAAEADGLEVSRNTVQTASTSGRVGLEAHHGQLR